LNILWQNNQTRQTEEHKIGHVFVMTGADPNTHWLDGSIALNTKGIIKTGPYLSSENPNTYGWPLARQPYLLETSLPCFCSGRRKWWQHQECCVDSR